MPLITRAAIRQELGRRKHWVIPRTGVGTTTTNGNAGGTTLTDTALYSTAQDQHIKNRSVVAILESTARGQRRLATGPADSSGIVTVSPAFSAQIASGVDYEIWYPDAPHPDEIDLCIDRALERLCWQWHLTPLTLLPGGDVGDDLSISSGNVIDGASVTVWTATNATPTLPQLTPPSEFTRRAIRVTASATPGYLQSQDIDVVAPDADDSGATEISATWEIHALVRAQGTVFATQDARIVVYDVTNSAAITTDPTILQSTQRGWQLISGTFTIPDGCDRIAIRLQVQTNAYVGDFAWIQLWNPAYTTYSLPLRIPSKRFVGPVYERIGSTYKTFQRREWRGQLERRETPGRTVELHFGQGVSNPLWFYERVGYPTLTTATPVAGDDDNSTWAAEDWIVGAALVECYRLLRARDKQPDGSSRWDGDLLEAETELIALNADYGIEMMPTDDSPKPSGRAILSI